MQALAPIRNVLPSRYVTNFGGLVPRLLRRSDLRLLLGGQNQLRRPPAHVCFPNLKIRNRKLEIIRLRIALRPANVTPP